MAKSLVGEFLEEKKIEREEAARAKRPRRPWRPILATIAIVACAAVWLIPSLGARPMPRESFAREDAGVRLTLFLASQRVRDFERRHGRLPRTTSEAGISDARVDYRLTSTSSFTLGLIHDGMRWELPSTAADTAYMHEALKRLAAPAR